MKKLFICFMLILSSFSLFADFTEVLWQPLYKIKSHDPEEFEKKMRNFYNENSAYFVWTKNSNSEIYKKYIPENFKFVSGDTISFYYYLHDVKEIIHFEFSVHDKSLSAKLLGYSSDFYIDNENRIIINSHGQPFNEYKEDENQEKIMASFEKNVLEKLELKWKHSGPTVADRIWNVISQPLYPAFWK